jgi:hypothetical protein
MLLAPNSIGVVPAGTAIVSYDSYGQPTYHGFYQQPMQVIGIGVMGASTFAQGAEFASSFAQGISGLAQGIAGLALTGSAANSRRRTGRKWRQSKTKPTALSDDFQDCLEESASTNVPDDSEPISSPRAEPAQEESTQDVEKLNLLMTQLQEGGQPCSDAISAMCGSVLELAMDSAGCRVVQLALDVASQKEAANIVSELHGHVHEAAESKHGNYVLQKAIEVLPFGLISFVVKELEDKANEVAQHRFGCRILCRLFEHAAGEVETMELIEKVLYNARELSRHAYGYHVLRCILEHGQPDHRDLVALACVGGAQRHAKHRTASFVIEKALAHCDPDSEARNTLASELLERPEIIVELAKHQYGRHVVSQLVRVPGYCSEKALDNLRCGLAQVQSTKHGRRLVEELRSQIMSSEAATSQY